MLGHTKKLITSVAEWVDGGSGGDRSAWNFRGGVVDAPVGDAAFAVWDIWRRGSWPIDNWLATPLSLLAQIQAIDTVYATWRYYRAKDSDFKKMTGTQREIIRRVERWLIE